MSETSTREGEERGPGTGELDRRDWLERVVAGLSVAFTLFLLGALVLQAMTTPTVPVPSATVQSVESPPFDDRGPSQLRVTVQFVNQGGTGIELATVGVQCGAVHRSVEFEYVPATDHKSAMVTCPVGTRPTATVETWMEA